MKWVSRISNPAETLAVSVNIVIRCLPSEVFKTLQIYFILRTSLTVILTGIQLYWEWLFSLLRWHIETSSWTIWQSCWLLGINVKPYWQAVIKDSSFPKKWKGLKAAYEVRRQSPISYRRDKTRKSFKEMRARVANYTCHINEYSFTDETLKWNKIRDK